MTFETRERLSSQQAERRVNRIFISLGSNIEKEKNMPLAVQMLGEICRIVAVSNVYETVPVGLLDQPNFFNAAVLIETDLCPVELKAEVLSILEERLGRLRTSDKNAPRTVDADMVLCNDEVFEYVHDDGRRRHVPDPDLLRFPHVAVPISELDSDMRHPETHELLTDLAQRLTAETVQKLGCLPLWKRPDIQLVQPAH